MQLNNSVAYEVGRKLAGSWLEVGRKLAGSWPEVGREGVKMLSVGWLVRVCVCLPAHACVLPRALRPQRLQVIPTADLLGQARAAVEAWAGVSNHPHLVGLRAAFVSAELEGSSSLFFAHDYYPGASTLAQVRARTPVHHVHHRLCATTLAQECQGRSCMSILAKSIIALALV